MAKKNIAPAPKIDSIEDLVTNLLTAKTEEELARQRRIALEERIVACFPSDALEGTDTHDVDGHRVKIVRSLTRTIDEEAYFDIKHKLSLTCDPVTVKPSLNLKRLRAIEMTNPEAFAICQTFITIKPAKTAVKIEEVE